jgi:hypothetical protein
MQYPAVSPIDQSQRVFEKLNPARFMILIAVSMRGYCGHDTDPGRTRGFWNGRPW